MTDNEDWIKIAGKIEEFTFDKNNIACVTIHGKSICLVQSTYELKACSASCPHAAGDLSKGFLDAKGNIICPVHGYRFNLTSGRDSNSEGYFLKIYKVKRNEEGIFIKLA